MVCVFVWRAEPEPSISSGHHDAKDSPPRHGEGGYNTWYIIDGGLHISTKKNFSSIRIDFTAAPVHQE